MVRILRFWHGARERRHPRLRGFRKNAAEAKMNLTKFVPSPLILCARPHQRPGHPARSNAESNAKDYLLLRALRVLLRDDFLALLRFGLETFALFFVTRFLLVFLEPLFSAARREDEDLLPLDFFEAPLRLAPKSLVFFAARTVERAALAAAWAPLTTCRAVRLTSRITGLPLSARLPSTAPTTPPIAAPTGPPTAPTTAPVAAPAVDLLSAGIAIVSSLPGTFFLDADFLAIGFVILRKPFLGPPGCSPKIRRSHPTRLAFTSNRRSGFVPTELLPVANFATEAQIARS
jgi:hypothetical protein